jgi:hypothetical protein
MNFKVFISVNIHTVALSWSSREREHPAPAARSLLHLVWDTLYIGTTLLNGFPIRVTGANMDGLPTEGNRNAVQMDDSSMRSS